MLQLPPSLYPFCLQVPWYISLVTLGTWCLLGLGLGSRSCSLGLGSPLCLEVFVVDWAHWWIRRMGREGLVWNKRHLVVIEPHIIFYILWCTCCSSFNAIHVLFILISAV
ncbi:hypothetical protein BDZ97DRAFT_1815129 [Flammula alnicola]|nr:hypothetical protein BDZ97DRAFT_1815129 [Flammula alnicola]